MVERLATFDMLKCLAAHWYNLKLKQRYEKKQ